MCRLGINSRYRTKTSNFRRILSIGHNVALVKSNLRRIFTRLLVFVVYSNPSLKFSVYSSPRMTLHDIITVYNLKFFELWTFLENYFSIMGILRSTNLIIAIIRQHTKKLLIKGKNSIFFSNFFKTKISLKKF